MNELTTFPEYGTFFTGLRERIRAAHVRAMLAVNRELVLLYWRVGRDLSARMRAHGWGANRQIIWTLHKQFLPSEKQTAVICAKCK